MESLQMEVENKINNVFKGAKYYCECNYPTLIVL